MPKTKVYRVEARRGNGNWQPIKGRCMFCGDAQIAASRLAASNSDKSFQVRVVEEELSELKTVIVFQGGGTILF